MAATRRTTSTPSCERQKAQPHSFRSWSNVPMRIRSDIFVSALTRRVFSDGGYAAIVAKGSEASGAIFVRQRFRDGLETLYGPAPQAMIGEEDRDDRIFEPRLTRAEPEAVEALIAREQKFDSDLWLVEIEVEEGKPRMEPLIPLASIG
eukprot:gene63718-87140_t